MTDRGWTRTLRSAAGRWPGRTALAGDGLLVAALVAASFVPSVSTIGAEIGDLPGRPPDAFAAVLVLVQCLPLALRRRWPAACLVVVGAGFVTRELLGYPTSIAGVALYVALYSVGAYAVRWRPAPAVAASAAYVVFAVALHELGSPQQLPDFVAFYLAPAVAWAAGAGVRRWRAQEARLRHDAAERATAGERARIARELHDVVTHHVTAMVVQADAGQYLVAAAPDRAAAGLGAIAGTGRRALTELRALLDVLEATGGSAPAARVPALGTLPDLVEQARLAGQPVELIEHGAARPLPVDAELAAYRVVQEALTNAMKHATGSRTVVQVEHAADGVEIEVVSAAPPAGRAVPAAGTGSGGRGMAGLHERVRMVGGELDTRRSDDGGFRVHARIPLRSTP